MARNPYSDVVRSVVEKAINLQSFGINFKARLNVAIEIIRDFKLSTSTVDWFVKRLIDEYGWKNGISFFFEVYDIAVSLAKIGISRKVAESLLKEIIALGWESQALSFSNLYLLRDLNREEFLLLLEADIRSASIGSNDEEDFITVAKKSNLEDLIPEIQNRFEEKRKRFF